MRQEAASKNVAKEERETVVEDFFGEKIPSIDPIFLKALDQISPGDVLRKWALDQPKSNETSKKRKNSGTKHITIDLHGKNLEESFFLIDKVFSSLAGSGPTHFKIITGRGVHSPLRGVLVHEVYQYVLQRYSLRIMEISDDPTLLKVGGMPLRGYFTVRLKGG